MCLLNINPYKDNYYTILLRVLPFLAYCKSLYFLGSILPNLLIMLIV